MPLSNIDDIFPNATVSDGDILIPAGDLVSNATPVATEPEEIVFGMLETLHQGVVAGTPTYITTSATSSLINANTYRRVYTFVVDLDFNVSNILADLDVKPEPTV
jgi:hypothetical protein